jgi:hypothetical protein
MWTHLSCGTVDGYVHARFPYWGRPSRSAPRPSVGESRRGVASTPRTVGHEAPSRDGKTHNTTVRAAGVFRSVAAAAPAAGAEGADEENGEREQQNEGAVTHHTGSYGRSARSVSSLWIPAGRVTGQGSDRTSWSDPDLFVKGQTNPPKGGVTHF